MIYNQLLEYWALCQQYRQGDKDTSLRAAAHLHNAKGRTDLPEYLNRALTFVNPVIVPGATIK